MVESVSATNEVTLRFSVAVTKLVALRDVSSAANVTENYSVGQIVRVVVSKTGRLSLKRQVMAVVDPSAQKRDCGALLQAFDKLQSSSLEAASSGLSIGAKTRGRVQLVKDYGLILQLGAEGINEGSDQLTGFIVNEQKVKTDKVYRAGESELDCIVLDIDREKKIVDLSERLYTVEETKDTQSKKKAGK